MEKGQPGKRYLLGSSNQTLSAFFDDLAKISGIRAPCFKMPRSPIVVAGAFGAFMSRLGISVDRGSAEMAQCFWYLDNSLARQELSWAPRDPLETIRDTI